MRLKLNRGFADRLPPARTFAPAGDDVIWIVCIDGAKKEQPLKLMSANDAMIPRQRTHNRFSLRIQEPPLLTN